MIQAQQSTCDAPPLLPTSTDQTAAILEIAGRANLSSPELRAVVQETLEGGGILFFPRMGFEPSARERQLISTARFQSRAEAKRANPNGRPTILFDPVSKTLEHARVRGTERRELQAMLDRFATWARDLVEELLPSYAAAIEQDRVTFRPCARIAPQPLHVDSSYGHPTQGRGMLRVFCNIDPDRRARVWQVGESFEPFASRFVPQLRAAEPPRTSWLLERLRITKGRRNAYDQMIADLRRAGKDDSNYLQTAPRRVVEFPPGSTWIAITDLVLHGALSGQYSLDQTFYLPAEAMQSPARSSLRILERLSGRKLL
jgi:3-deoxy-D-manno-oct-2-ulosonic acid (Kdo) hydroxylase